MQVINFSLRASGYEQPLHRKGFKRHSCEVLRAHKVKKSVVNPFTLNSLTSPQEIDLQNPNAPRKSRISIVQLQYQKTLTFKNNCSNLEDFECELPPVNKMLPVTHKRYSNIKYIELRDIVKKPSPPPVDPYPLIKKSTMTSYAKRVL